MEAERALQFAQQLEHAKNEVLITALSGIASLGIGTALTALAAGGETLSTVGTMSLRAKNLETAAHAAAQARIAGSEVSTVSKVFTYVSNIGASDAGATLFRWPRLLSFGGTFQCSGMVSPSVFGNMVLPLSEKAYTFIMSQALSSCVNAVARVNLGIAFGEEGGSLLPSHWGAAKEAKQAALGPSFEEKWKAIEARAKSHLGTFQGRYFGLVGMRWDQFRDFTIRVEKEVREKIALSAFGKVTGRWVNPEEHPEQRAVRLGESGGKQIWGVQELRKDWEKLLDKKQKEELWLAASCRLRDYWTRVYGDLQPRHIEMRSTILRLERKSEELVRELGAALAPAPRDWAKEREQRDKQATLRAMRYGEGEFDRTHRPRPAVEWASDEAYARQQAIDKAREKR